MDNSLQPKKVGFALPADTLNHINESELIGKFVYKGIDSDEIIGEIIKTETTSIGTKVTFKLNNSPASNEIFTVLNSGHKVGISSRKIETGLDLFDTLTSNGIDKNKLI